MIERSPEKYSGESQFPQHGDSARCFADRRVLVADDDDLVRAVVRDTITKAIGCHVEVVENGDQVLECLERESWDVLLTDMMMPGIHGLELVRRVSGRWPQLEIVVLSGFSAEFPFVEVLRAGATDFVNKPHHPGELEAKLLRLFHERELREQLQFAEAKYRSLFELSGTGKLIIDRETQAIVDANKAFCGLIDVEQEAVIGSSIFDHVAAHERERIEEAFRMFEATGRGMLGGITLYNADKEELSVDIRANFISVGRERVVFLTIRDLTERRHFEDQLTSAMYTDELTRLSNKRALFPKLEFAVNRAHREDVPISLMFIDLDNFKHCNDTYGHQVGDVLLRSVGKIIRRSIRHESGDEGFRYGGDEFAVLLEGVASGEAMVVGERMRVDFEKGQQYGTSMSIGLAQLKPGMLPAELITASDEALYEAKASGKNVIHVA